MVTGDGDRKKDNIYVLHKAERLKMPKDNKLGQEM